MVKKVSEVPSKAIVLDFSNAGNPTFTYTGTGWTGKDIRVAINLVKHGYAKQRYSLAHKKA